MGGEIIRFIEVLLIFTVSLLYCYFIASKLPKGKLRLLSLLPIFYLFAILPFYLSSLLLTGTITFFTWLTIFKLFLFSFDSGPLVSDPPLPFPLFASIAFFPTRIKHNKTAPCDQSVRKCSNIPQEVSQEPPPNLALNLVAKVVIFAILVLANNYYVELVSHPIAKVYINCWILYFYLDMIMSLSNAFIQSTFGVKVQQQFDKPYLATSLQNFWGQRWNLLVSETLHNMIYKPIRYEMGCPRWVATIGVFVVSGLMHELLYYYIIKVTPTWEAMWYFVIHGVYVAVEIELKKMLGNRWHLHWAVSRPLTIAFLVFTSHWLLFPPLLRTGKKIF